LKEEYNRHCTINEYTGPTVPYTSKKKDWLREKCPGCWKQFRYNAGNAAIRCCVCADINNSHCTHCIVAAGASNNVPMCPVCATSYYKVDVSLEYVYQLNELDNLKIAQILETTDNVVIQFVAKQTDTLLYCKSVLVDDRFAEFTRGELINVLGKTNFDKLVQDYLNRQKNVVFEEYTIDLKKGLKEYVEARGEDLFYGQSIKNNCNWDFKQSKFKVKVSSIGPLEFDGHVIAPGIRNIIVDQGEYEKKAIEEYDKIFPDEQEFKDNKIATNYCHAVLLKTGEVAILGLEEAYKGKGNCWKGLTYSEELQQYILSTDTNKLIKDDEGDGGYYWTKKELENAKEINWTELTKKKKGSQTKYKLLKLKKQPQLKVVPSGDDLKEYLKKKHPNLMSSMQHYELLSNVLSYTIATQIPQLKPVFYQHIRYNHELKCPYPHGSWYGNKDFIKYWGGSKVVAHIDHQDLVQVGDYHFGPYVVFKLGGDSADQVLCSVSNKSSGCEFDRSKPKGDRDHGGHVTLPSGTIYWMFDEGACGGISHSIHNAKAEHDLWSSQLFGGFESKSYTLVMRPFLIRDTTIFGKKE